MEIHHVGQHLPAQAPAHLRRTLRDLCDQALNFENHFLTIYRKYQLAELASADPERQNLAIQRLREIVFPDDEVASALAKVQMIRHPDDDR